VPETLNVDSLLNLCMGNQNPIRFEERSGKVGCVDFQRSSDRAYVIISRAERLNGFPLLIVTPGTGSTKRSLEKVFEANQIIKRDIATICPSAFANPTTP
jgi:hypothetical protein